MSKLKLHLDDLRIDSFTTTSMEKPKGTVFGEQCTCPTQCTCPGCPTCYASCNGTCDASCNGTCGASCNGTCGATCNGTCDASCNGTCVDCDTGGGFSQCDYTCYNGVYGLEC
jgi:hypothetical protein